MLGELLIDFTQSGTSPAGMRLFEQNPGGAVANVACVLSGFGKHTGFAGKVGADMHGDYLRSVLEEKGVDTRGLISDPDVFTTLAFVSLSDSGERSFSFARKPGADTCLCQGEIDMNMLQNCKIFHFGSLSLTDQPVRGATLTAVSAAKDAGAIISYDPNYRASLWPNSETAITQMRSPLEHVDLIKISDEETVLLTGYEDPAAAAAALLDQGIGCVVVTLGANGAYAANCNGSVQLSPPTITALDTTGAGDAFWGAFLYRLLEADAKPSDLPKDALADCVRFANAAGALCVQKRGGIPALPSLEDVIDLLSSSKSKRAKVTSL